MRNLLFIDTSYTYNQIINRNSINIILARDLNQYFNKVISIHPTANLTNKFLFKNNSYYKKNIINKQHIFFEFKASKRHSFFILEYLSFIFYQTRMILKLIKIIKEEKITDIKCGDINYSGLLGMLLSFFTNIKFYVRVGSNNDKIREVIKRPLQPKFFRLTIIEKYFENIISKRASHIFPANNDNAKFVSKYLKNTSKLTVIRYGPLINDIHYVPRENRIISHEELNLLVNTNCDIVTCLARFEKVKKVDHVILVFKKLLKKNKKLKLFLVGDGSLREEYIRLSKKLNIFQNIVFSGDKNQKWISELLSITDLIISPHTGRALCEAALAGCKIVGYDIDWQSEIIMHKKNGFLAKYGDVNQLTLYALEILENPIKYELFGLELRKKAFELLDKHKSLNDEIKVYNYL